MKNLPRRLAMKGDRHHTHVSLSKNQRLTELCRKIDAHDGCGG
jgi:hypothetical protein